MQVTRLLFWGSSTGLSEFKQRSFEKLQLRARESDLAPGFGGFRAPCPSSSAHAGGGPIVDVMPSRKIGSRGTRHRLAGSSSWDLR